MAEPQQAELVAEPPVAIDWTLSFAQELTRDGSAYWERCCRGRRMPGAKDLLPRDMKPLLPHVALIDVRSRQDAYDFRVRLAGDGIRLVFGNVSGKWLNEFLTPRHEQRWRLAFEAVCARRVRVRSHGAVAFAGKQWLDFETLIAPLGHGIVVTDLFVVFTTWSRRDPGPVIVPAV